MSAASSVHKTQFKCALLGSGGVGKTTFIKRLGGEGFEVKYLPTTGVEISTFETGAGLEFNICDYSGQERYQGIDYDGIRDSDLIILMFDLTSKITYKSLDYYYRIAKELAPDASIVICGNKIDCSGRSVPSSMITMPAKYGLSYYEMSVKNDKDVLTMFKDFIDRRAVAAINDVSASTP